MRRMMPLVVVLELSICGGAFAQNSPDYHARHNAQSPYYVGPRDQEQQALPKPDGYWQKTWGAIAANGAAGLLGYAVGANSEEEAKNLALADCHKKGLGCEIEFAYYNQCAVVVTGDTIFNTVHARSIERASKIGISQCQKEDTNCRVYYSACTDPIYHRF